MRLPEYIAAYLDAPPQLVTFLLMGLGALVLAVGAALLLVSLLSLERAEDSPHEDWQMVSKLLPLLAQDTLDPDLRAIYQKSLYLDALITDVAPSLTTPTGTELGRRVRRALLSIESSRYNESEEGTDTGQFDELIRRMDTAIDAAERARPAPQVDLRELAEALELSEVPPKNDRAV